MAMPCKCCLRSRNESTIPGGRAIVERFPDTGNEVETYPDNASSQTRGDNSTKDLVREGKEFGMIVLGGFSPTFSPWIYGTHAEDSAMRSRSTWFEERVSIEQKSDTDEEDTVIVDSRPFTRPHLACPFYISHKEKYRDCLAQDNLYGIEDLKQHLEVEHLQPSYCPTCYDTFTSTEDWKKHIRHASCIPSDKSRPEGVSILQIQQLAQLSNNWASLDLQWKLIWEIIFPGVESPLGAFSLNAVENVV
ncbi:hypothetical protein ANO14919_061830 [Xylariales sp. No.14919]|nr:hypothetical protein ANO14919_061830 [Xylariales sp. No.14919]